MTERILHLSTVHSAGDNRIARKECRALADAGFNVHLATRNPNNVTLPNITIHELPEPASRARRVSSSMIAAAKAVRAVDPAILHIHDPELVPLALAWRRRTRRPIIYDAHESLSLQVDSKEYIPRGLRRPTRKAAQLLERLAARFDAVVTATPVIKSEYQLLARNAGRVVTIQNFPWLSDFTVPRSSLPSVDLIYVGGVTVGRGAHEMQTLARNLPTRHLRVIGAGAEHFAGEAPVNLTYSAAIPAHMIPQELASARAGMSLLRPQPNYLKSQPTKIFEYMATGIPFVASDFDHWEHLLGFADAGIFVPVDDPKETAHAVLELLADERRCRELGDNGRHAVQERFSFEKESATLVNLVTSLC